MRCLAIPQSSHIAIHPEVLDFLNLVFPVINRMDGDWLNLERTHSYERAIIYNEYDVPSILVDNCDMLVGKRKLGTPQDFAQYRIKLRNIVVRMRRPRIWYKAMVDAMGDAGRGPNRSKGGPVHVFDRYVSRCCFKEL